jgi:hypothetical protein
MTLCSVLLQPICQNTRKSTTPDVYLGCGSSLVCRRTRQGMTRRTSRLTMIRSQACIGARRSCATARAGLMANRGCLHDGFWSVWTNMVRMERLVAVVVGLTVVISSMCSLYTQTNLELTVVKSRPAHTPAPHIRRYLSLHRTF